MPRLVRGLILSYAPENAVIEAAGPREGMICTPSGLETRHRSHPRPCLPALVSMGGLAHREVTGQTGEAHLSSLPVP